jgi:uncharacterized protein (TIGR03086 family)
MSRNLRAYTRALYTVDGVVRRVKESDWLKQSPNDDWSAKETLGHVIWGVRRIAAAARDEPTPDPQPEAVIPGDDPVMTWSSAMDNVLEALDHHGVLTKTIDTPFGEMTVDDAVGRFFTDPLTHAWDIAAATGVDAAIPEDLAERAIGILSALGDAIRGPGRFDDAIEVEETASTTDKFIALTGRQP